MLIDLASRSPVLQKLQFLNAGTSVFFAKRVFVVGQVIYNSLGQPTNKRYVTDLESGVVKEFDKDTEVEVKKLKVVEYS